MALGRGRRHPERQSVWLSTETASKLREASERYGLAPGVIAREAIEAGLKAVLERYRSRARARESRESRQGR